MFLSEKGTAVVLKNVEEGQEELQYKIGEHEIRIDGLSCTVSKELMEEKTEKPKNQEEKKYISFKNNFPEKPEKEEGKGKAKTFKIYKEAAEKKNNSKIGEITIETKESKSKAIFRLEDTEKKERLSQILEILKNGLIYHSSGENDGIVPQFMIAAGLKLPIPLFNSFVELGSFESSILGNSYILNGTDTNKKLVYVYDPKNLSGSIDTTNLYTNWDEFLKQLGVKQ